MSWPLKLQYRNTYDKVCTICGKEFKTGIKNKNICSFDCKMQHNRDHYKLKGSKYNVLKRKNYSCVVCGFSETCDLHSEKGKKYPLCPNHHALITRNIKTLEEVLASAQIANFSPEPILV